MNISAKRFSIWHIISLRAQNIYIYYLSKHVWNLLMFVTLKYAIVARINEVNENYL
jgi:hypothetical protein